MFTRRVVPAIIVLGLLFGLMASISLVSAQAQETLGGSVKFRDATKLSDSAVIALTGVPQPAAGTKYYGWLVSPDGATKTSVGELTVSAAGAVNKTYTSPDGSNLLKTYHAFAISSSATAPAPGLYVDFVPTGAFTHVGHHMVSFPTTPTNKGLSVGMREQAQIALDHANLAKAATTLAEKKLHLQHIINLVEGSKGANFKVIAGDPSDGFGILVYASTSITHAGLAKTAAPTDTTVVAFADGVIASTNNVVAAVTTARNNGVQGLAETSLGLVLDLAVDNAVANMTKAVNGTDADGDGVAGSTAAEGGTKQEYLQAQDMGSLVLVKGALALPTPTPTPTARPPRTGDVDTGSTALGVVLAGLAMMVVGAYLLLRRRDPAGQ